MFGSRSTEESLTKDILSTSSDKTRRDATHILENLLNHDLMDEECSAFMQVFQYFASIGRIDGIITLSAEDLCTLHTHLKKGKYHPPNEKHHMHQTS